MTARNYTQDLSPEDDADKEMPAHRGPARSIRDFRPSAERRKLQMPTRVAPTREAYGEDRDEERPRRSRLGIWIAAGIALIVLTAAATLILYPATSITITPHTHVITFDASNPLTAYPAAAAATGTIP